MEPFTRAAAFVAAALVGTSAGIAAADDAAPPAIPNAPIVASATSQDPGAEVVFRALSLLGVNYRFGGNTPDTGLDCSGLVRLVFHEALGLPLPRRSEEISRVGGAVTTADLQPGDLVFFNTLRRAFSHVGIYIGNNQFVHAPSTGGSIRVENLGADYWSRRFDGARRLLTADLAGAAAFTPLATGATARPVTAPLTLAAAPETIAASADARAAAALPTSARTQPKSVRTQPAAARATAAQRSSTRQSVGPQRAAPTRSATVTVRATAAPGDGAFVRARNAGLFVN